MPKNIIGNIFIVVYRCILMLQYVAQGLQDILEIGATVSYLRSL